MFNFDLSNGFVLLRLLIGLFLIPHIIGKVKYRIPVTGFFDAVGFKPAPVFVNVAMVFEIVAALALILGVYAQIAAALLAVFMFVAAAANHKMCKGKWLWNIGGSEYPIFWGLCCVIVALNPT
jgi:putative oxidoreductase